VYDDSVSTTSGCKKRGLNVSGWTDAQAYTVPSIAAGERDASDPCMVASLCCWSPSLKTTQSFESNITDLLEIHG